MAAAAAAVLSGCGFAWRHYGVAGVEQLPGDVLYIPPGWYHGTWNRGIAIGVSLQAALSVHQASANSKAMLAANKDR